MNLDIKKHNLSGWLWTLLNTDENCANNTTSATHLKVGQNSHRRTQSGTIPMLVQSPKFSAPEAEQQFREIAWLLTLSWHSVEGPVGSHEVLSKTSNHNLEN